MMKDPMRSRRPTRPALLALAAAALAVPAAALQVSELSVARMAAPFIGGTAAPLTVSDRMEIDSVMGNRNGVYDIGDVRLVLNAHPELIPAGPVRTTRSPR